MSSGGGEGERGGLEKKREKGTRAEWSLVWLTIKTQFPQEETHGKKKKKKNPSHERGKRKPRKERGEG